MKSASPAIWQLALLVCVVASWPATPGLAQVSRLIVDDAANPTEASAPGMLYYAPSMDMDLQQEEQYAPLLPMAEQEDQYSPLLPPSAIEGQAGPESLMEYAMPYCNKAPTLAGHLFGPCSVFGAASSDEGLGTEWLAVSPFEIDTAQPLNHMRVRLDAAYDQHFPDRAEFFWARIGGRGPAIPEDTVDYQDIRFLMEVAGDKFSVGTEIPIRIVDPDLNGNTAGMGDMSLTTKLVMFEGRRWQVTQFFKTYFNTGSPSHGTGNGHISLEPGLLFRYECSPYTDLHSEVKFWFPLGGDPLHAGEVLRYGLGLTHLHHDGDSFAIISVWEFVAWSVLDGAATNPLPLGNVVPIDGVGILNFHPGLRFVFDRGGDWGVWDLGISAGFALTNNHWYEAMARAELRWTW